MQESSVRSLGQMIMQEMRVLNNEVQFFHFYTRCHCLFKYSGNITFQYFITDRCIPDQGTMHTKTLKGPMLFSFYFSSQTSVIINNYPKNLCRVGNSIFSPVFIYLLVETLSCSLLKQVLCCSFQGFGRGQKTGQGAGQNNHLVGGVVMDMEEVPVLLVTSQRADSCFYTHLLKNGVSHP